MTIYKVWGLLVTKIHVPLFRVMTSCSLLNDDNNNDDYLHHNYHDWLTVHTERIMSQCLNISHSMHILFIKKIITVKMHRYRLPVDPPWISFFCYDSQTVKPQDTYRLRFVSNLRNERLSPSNLALAKKKYKYIYIYIYLCVFLCISTLWIMWILSKYCLLIKEEIFFLKNSFKSIHFLHNQDSIFMSRNSRFSFVIIYTKQETSLLLKWWVVSWRMALLRNRKAAIFAGLQSQYPKKNKNE